MNTSGLLLDFPDFGLERWLSQRSHLIHAGFALVPMAGTLEQIYIGTECVLEGMATGKVDKSWAIQHHGLWCEQFAADGTGSSLSDKPPIPETSRIASRCLFF